MNTLRKIVFFTTIVMLIFSCGKKEELMPDTPCRLSKIYADGAVQQVYGYNETGKIANISFYTSNYYASPNEPKSKIYEEYVFEYDNSQRLMGYKSRFSPTINNMKLGYENDKITSFVISKYDDKSVGKVSYNADNQIKTIRIDYANNSAKTLNYVYYADGNLRSVTNMYRDNWGTSSVLNEFFDYDNNSSNPFLNVQPLIYSYLLQINNNFQPISSNNPQKIIVTTIYNSSTDATQINFVITLNRYKYPEKIISIARPGTPYPYTVTYEYEYENCQ